MLLRMYGCSFSCSFGVTTSRCMKLLYRPPAADTTTYPTSAIGRIHRRWLKAYHTATSAAIASTTRSAQKNGRRAWTSAYDAPNRMLAGVSSMWRISSHEPQAISPRTIAPSNDRWRRAAGMSRSLGQSATPNRASMTSPPDSR